ncbi:MAG: FAD-dependent monooxygenase [Rubrivivax sp.]
MNPTPDVLIAGAGPAGLALATALAKLGRRVTVFEQQPRAAVEDLADDGREIALTHRARRVLQALGHWERLPEDEISLLVEVRVSSGTSPFVLPFEARAAGHDNLGWLVPNRLLRRAAWEAAAEEGVSVVFETRVTAFERSAGTATLHFADGRGDGAAGGGRRQPLPRPAAAGRHRRRHAGLRPHRHRRPAGARTRLRRRGARMLPLRQHAGHAADDAQPPPPSSPSSPTRRRPGRRWTTPSRAACRRSWPAAWARCPAPARATPTRWSRSTRTVSPNRMLALVGDAVGMHPVTRTATTRPLRRR